MNSEVLDDYQAEISFSALNDAHFRMLAEMVPHLVWTIGNGDTLQPEYCNQRWCEYTGLSMQAIKNGGWQEAIHPDDLVILLYKWELAKKSGKIFEIEYRIKRYSDGTYRWHVVRAIPLYDVQGKIIKWFGTCTDIEVLKRAQLALKTTSEHLNIALDAAKAGVWSWDIVKDCILWDEQQFYLFGTPPSDQLQTYETFLQYVHPQDRMYVEEKVKIALNPEIQDYEAEYRIIWPDSSIHIMFARGKVNFDENNQPIEMIGIAWDITEQRNLENRLRQHQAELAQATTLSSMGEVASTLAHELNQPLTAIATYSQLCLAKVQSMPRDSSNEECFSYLEHIAKQAERAGEILHRVRNFSRHKILTKEEVNLNEVLKEVFEFLVFEKFSLASVICWELDDGLPNIIVDKIQLQQVLINLIKNSIEAMSEAKIKIPHLVITTKRDNKDYLSVSIRDNGPGIIVELQKKIFDPYFTTKGHGTGIGLSICRTIIEAHGGQFILDTSYQTGACFRFTLPILPNDYV